MLILINIVQHTIIIIIILTIIKINSYYREKIQMLFILIQLKIQCGQAHKNKVRALNHLQQKILIIKYLIFLTYHNNTILILRINKVQIKIIN